MIDTRHALPARGEIPLAGGAHPLHPEQRKTHLPPAPDEVKPIVIGNNVWIGDNVKIMPGVTIGDGAVIAAGSVVGGAVPPNTLVAGYPARKLRDLTG